MMGKSFSSGLDDGANRSTIGEQSASQRTAYFSGDASDSVHSGLPFDLDQPASPGAGHLLPNRDTHAKQQTANET
jgi:hypothetical protein